LRVDAVRDGRVVGDQPRFGTGDAPIRDGRIVHAAIPQPIVRRRGPLRRRVVRPGLLGAHIASLGMGVRPPRPAPSAARLTGIAFTGRIRPNPSATVATTRPLVTVPAPRWRSRPPIRA